MRPTSRSVVVGKEANLKCIGVLERGGESGRNPAVLYEGRKGVEICSRFSIGGGLDFFFCFWSLAGKRSFSICALLQLQGGNFYQIKSQFSLFLLSLLNNGGNFSHPVRIGREG